MKESLYFLLKTDNKYSTLILHQQKNSISHFIFPINLLTECLRVQQRAQHEGQNHE